MRKKSFRQRKRRRTGAFTFVAAGLFPAFVPGTAPAEFRGCDADDPWCLDDVVSNACSPGNESWPQSCQALLDELMQYPNKENEPEILSHAALANVLLSQEAESEADAGRYSAAADILYRQVIGIAPDHADASVYFAQAATDPLEEIEWLRNAYSTRQNPFLLRWLAGALGRLGTPESQLEAAAILREAYESRPWGTGKWNDALSTLHAYRQLGLESEAHELQETVRREIGVGELLESLTFAESDSEASLETLRILCYDSVVGLVSIDPCVSGAELVFAAAVRTADPELALQLTKAGLHRMRSLPRRSGGALHRVAGVVYWLEALVFAGIESEQLYFALGRCYMDLGRHSDALDALEQARTLPGFDWRSYVDGYMQIARDPAASPQERHYCIETDTVTVN